MKLVSTIPGVQVTSEQVGGLRKFQQLASCVGCDATLPINLSTASPLPRQVVFKKMQQVGWKPHKKGKHLCPHCREKTRPAPQAPDMCRTTPLPKAAPVIETTPGRELPHPMTGRGGTRRANPVTWRGQEFPTQTALAKHLNRGQSSVSRALKAGTLDQLDIKQEKEEPMQAAAAKKPADVREMSRDDRRRITFKLDEHYDTTKGRYVDNYTDHKVAEMLNVPRAWVAEVRDQTFGPDGSNDEMKETRARLEAAQARLKKAADACYAAIEEAEGLEAEVDDLRAKMGDLEAAVGPHRKAA